MSAYSESIGEPEPAYDWYSSGEGSLPVMAHTAASSAEARYTSAPLPRRLGKLRVEVDTQVLLSATRAWLPMQREQPGISMRAPALPKME